MCARLVCLNKNAEALGNLEAIRPIAVCGYFMKILEKIILNRLLYFVYLHNIICKKQIGFMRNLGCDINIMRLRERVKAAKEEGQKGAEKYVLFLDLKNTYDSVSHTDLFREMAKKNIPEEIINATKLLYSSAKISVNPLLPAINVNKGLMQGAMMSPILFNIFIDGFITLLDRGAWDVLGFADDIAIICQNQKELSLVIELMVRSDEDKDQQEKKWHSSGTQ